MGWRTKRSAPDRPEKLNPTPERSVSPWKLSVALWTTNLEPPAPACSCCRSSPAWLASIAGPALEGLQPLPVRYGVALLLGTMPFAHPGGEPVPVGHLNRAWLLLPHGRTFAQDNICLAPSEICLAPSEQNPKGWQLTLGTTVNVSSGRTRSLDIEFTPCGRASTSTS